MQGTGMILLLAISKQVGVIVGVKEIDLSSDTINEKNGEN